MPGAAQAAAGDGLSARIQRIALAVLDRVERAVETLSWHATTSAIRAIEWRKVAIDHDDFGSTRSKVINVIDSNRLEHDIVRKPLRTFRHHALVASAPFVLPSEWGAALVRIFAYLGAIAVMSIIAGEIFKQPQIIAMREPVTRPAWIEVDHPWPAFQLSVPGFADEIDYAIRRHAEGLGRKDTVSFGELGKTPRYITFEIYRAGQEAAAFAGAPDEVRALGAEQGRVSGLRETMPIGSKFGEFRLFEFVIAPFSGYRCVGFARAFDSQRVRIGGMSCNLDTIVDRSAMACGLDRLTLVSAASDPDISRLFAQAELKRTFCGQRDPLMYATSKRPGSDFSGSAKLKLRGRFAR